MRSIRDAVAAGRCSGRSSGARKRGRWRRLNRVGVIRRAACFGPGLERGGHHLDGDARAVRSCVHGSPSVVQRWGSVQQVRAVPPIRRWQRRDRHGGRRSKRDHLLHGRPRNVWIGRLPSERCRRGAYAPSSWLDLSGIAAQAGNPKRRCIVDENGEIDRHDPNISRCQRAIIDNLRQRREAAAGTKAERRGCGHGQPRPQREYGASAADG